MAVVACLTKCLRELDHYNTIHRHLRLVKQGGPDSLKRQETPNLRHKNCVDKAIEDAVVQFSIEHPHLGQQKVAIKLSEALGVDISAGGVRTCG